MKDENEMKDENRRLTLTITIKNGRLQIRLTAQHNYTTVRPSPQGANTKSSHNFNYCLDFEVIKLFHATFQYYQLETTNTLKYPFSLPRSLTGGLIIEPTGS